MKKRNYELNKEYFELLNYIYIMDKNMIPDKVAQDTALRVRNQEISDLVYAVRTIVICQSVVLDVIAPLTENDLKRYRKSIERFEKEYKPQYWDFDANDILEDVNLLAI